MSVAFQIVVCGSFVPDPLQTLEPVTGPTGPSLKNEMMLPAVLDPWAGHALFEAAALAREIPGSKVWLVSLGAKAKLQQVMMTVAQKAPFELVAERLGIAEQFQGVDQIAVHDDGSFEVLERVEGGRHQVSVCSGPPALLGWATGNLPEPRNNPQVGMANMRTVMPALQRAKVAPVTSTGLAFASVTLPKQQRQTRIVKDMAAEEVAREIVAWMGEE